MVSTLLSYFVFILLYLPYISCNGSLQIVFYYIFLIYLLDFFVFF